MAKRKIFGVMYPGSDWNQPLPFSDKKSDQREAYESFFTLARDEYGMEPVRFSQQWYKDGSFTRAWGWKGGRWIKLRKPILPDVIMDKSTLSYATLTKKMEINERFHVVNAWELDLISSDKMLTATSFADFTPETFLVRTKTDLHEALKKIPSAEVVMKPRLGYGGDGVQIISKQKARQVNISGLTIVQRFVDTQGGVPGLYRGIHDFRIIFAGDKPIISYIRTAAPGTKLCNMSLGGGVIFVPISKIPKVLKPYVQRVLRSFAVYPDKLFSVDFFFERGRPYLVEINSKPMIYFPPGHEKQTAQMQRSYMEYFSKLLDR
ncbi:MAG: hypothetical protein COW24_03995 [Candidatus Kerfeldbacteria bacterium CG15_BIG_FIL_POST_REV_8_21_14_020_45_12]|uniref:ATP-grasp domain-containing protein n=1 Tax=Candidatus Kerfeldbacteria bacterium CG15_BIG_FIL_POST_REV_8_21_14_020_45_12 TaxID=2014247 RepID=A0A2M7H385_9BACT|nr:MAG: hypothetical protein COW24_03995 [Candidatus Kerfeldbacteria bacterium CG15_BIG_FIL_POST_REV_8_21_14_020_45_12]PJA93848.1 MAG: hypothetical protein CO132_01140 [Candidatus Kerfeldbacteria bacterium CG_4_9_14_3_um_filter_45_8]